MLHHSHTEFLKWVPVCYILILSLIGLLSMKIDKSRAKRAQWRIPEKTLFLIALLGGSPGSILGMHLFHHKTKHWYFKYGMPLILILQIAAVVAVLLYRAGIIG